MIASQTLNPTISLNPAPADSSYVVQIESLTKTYTKAGGGIEVQALRGIDIAIKPTELVAICGASGSGKSTLLNILGCLDRPTTGRYFLAGQDVSAFPDDALSDIRGQRLGFVFQNFNLIPQLTVLENVEVPLFYQGVFAAERIEKARHFIEMVGLQDRANHRPNELSGGQQQRVAIARSLVNDPVLLLADEPTGNLDTATGEMVLAIFDRLHHEGKTIVMITHEPDVAARCDRTIVLRDGLVLSDQPHKM